MSDQVEEVKQKTDIVSIISEYVDLKKAGKNYKALCPFHSEKTPSFVVSPEMQYFKCFGCNESGDVISFLQKYEAMDFYEALKYLAERAGIKLQTQKIGIKSTKDKLYSVNSLASVFYHYVLLQHPSGKAALEYLYRRGIKRETIRTFRMGFSPDKPFAMRHFLIDKKKIHPKDLELAGLVYAKDGNYFDRFRGRVVFPLNDHRGNVVGFAGRILPEKEKLGLAKYINTPETEVYHKSKILYGLDLNRRDIKNAKSAVIVEGELDMISCWQIGIKNAVAIKGSALTQEQVKLLSRYTNELILALDADVAGDTAARRGIEIAEKEGFDIRVARLSGYKDPDEAARKNPEELSNSLMNAIGVWDFIIESVFSKWRGKSGVDKARISREIVPILASISDRIVQGHYINVVAQKLGVPLEAVTEQVNSTKGKVKDTTEKLVILKEEKKDRRELLEERLLSVAFRFNPGVLISRKIYSLLSSPLAKRIVNEFKLYTNKHKEFDPSLFAAQLPEELVNGFTDMVLKDIKGLSDEPEAYEKEITILVKEIRISEVKKELEQIAVKIKNIESTKDKKGLKKSQEKFGELSQRLFKLEETDLKGIIH